MLCTRVSCPMICKRCVVSWSKPCSPQTQIGLDSLCACKEHFQPMLQLHLLNLHWGCDFHRWTLVSHFAGLLTRPQRLLRTPLGWGCPSVPEMQSCSCVQGLIHYNGLAKTIESCFPYPKILPFPTSSLKTLFH